MASQESIKQMQLLMAEIEDPLKITFQNMHQGYPNETMMRFLKARDWNPSKAYKMLHDCLNWRIKNDIDNVLTRPITPYDLYRRIRDSQLVGLSGFSNQGLPVIAIGVGMSTFDKTYADHYAQSHIQMNEYRDRVILPMATQRCGRHIFTCVKVLDMSGLKLSALNQMQVLTNISSIDDLNYPEKTDTYYIVNAPYIFSACWKVVKPLLQERTRRKIQVLQGCGRDELLKIMEYAALPHFCRREGGGSSSSRHSRNSGGGTNDNCFSPDHVFHHQLYKYMSQLNHHHHSATPTALILMQNSLFHLYFPKPDPNESPLFKTIHLELDLRRCASDPPPPPPPVPSREGDLHSCERQQSELL